MIINRNLADLEYVDYTRLHLAKTYPDVHVSFVSRDKWDDPYQYPSAPVERVFRKGILCCSAVCVLIVFHPHRHAQKRSLRELGCALFLALVLCVIRQDFLGWQPSRRSKIRDVAHLPCIKSALELRIAAYQFALAHQVKIEKETERKRC